jgi:hypothetical protein
MAQKVARDLEEDDQRRRKEDENEKRRVRDEYGIGWRVEQIPRNFDLQQRLKDVLATQGMCCLVLEEGSKGIRLAPTMEPSAAVNLEYLSLALQVRRKEGREPVFSLDPVERESAHENKYSRDSSQVKRFEPDWLAGTSVGEVLFQADYHLKELSMGEYEQPVVGMKSIFDLCKAEDYQRWTAREWFMVRSAEVLLSDDNVLIPHVRMGVEAREQIHTQSCVQDAPITRGDHPMVKYAESFTRNFDLIAERKSVVYHLRELAKACVLAKFLVDSGTTIEEDWFRLAGEVAEASALEIPQLWNERLQSKIRVRDGEVIGMDKGVPSSLCGIYGGVSFGLDQFNLSQVAPRRVTAPDVVAAPARPPSAPRPLAGLVTSVPFSTMFRDESFKAGMLPPSERQMAPLASSLTAMRVPSLQAALSVPVTKPPKGVDLNLNQFTLDMAQKSGGNMVSECQSKEVCAVIVHEFWSCIDGQCASTWEPDELKLLRSVYNPSLSDRRLEGQNFSPPDIDPAFISKLSSLVKNEDEVRRQREEHFFSIAFSKNDPGPLFPSSWISYVSVARSSALKRGATLQLRKENTVNTEQVMKAGPPAFQKKTEDGMVWRIYCHGSLEVRTTQEHDGQEGVGAIFSVREELQGRSCSTAPMGHQKITKATEYVEKTPKATQDAKRPDCRYYIVFETESGSRILTELVQGCATWQENFSDLEDRNSLARVVRSANARTGITVQDLKHQRNQVVDARRSESSRCISRRYATSMFVAALGGLREAVQATEKQRKAMETQDLDPGEGDDLEDERVAQSAADEESVRLPPCARCRQPFVAGYKSSEDQWLCSGCWKTDGW